MPSFWDLLPAGAWPTQPFIPPFDPTQAGWPPGALPQWNPATSSAYGWSMAPAASAGMPLDTASAPPWDSAMPEGLATQGGATGDADAVDDDPRGAEAKRAYDFAQWMFGPPSAPQSPSMRATALTGAPLNASPPTLREADQSAGLGAATGNPNIERQGARARASRQSPPNFWDLLPAGAWTVQPFTPPLDATQPSARPAQIAPPQGSAANPSAFAAASGNAQTILADNSATPIAASQMSTPGPDDASNSAPSPNAPAGATYNPLTWTAADNPVSWMQQLYERREREFAVRHPERAAAIKRMADTRLGDVPSIDAPNAAHRMADGFAFGYGNEPIVPYQDIVPDTKIAAGGYELPDWAQPDAKFLWRSANVAPQLLDRALRALRGGAYGAAGAAAGLYQDLGGSEAWANRLQRDLGILAQYPPTDLSLVRPMALEPHAPSRALEPNPRELPPSSAEERAASAAPVAAGTPQYTRQEADLIRNWLGIAPERFRGTVRVDPPLIDGEILDVRSAPIGLIDRSISRDSGVAEHGVLLLSPDVQGQGLAKSILRANIDHYRQLGLSRVNVTALDRGGYVWARYGFLPSQESWDAVRPVLRGRVTDPSLNIAPAVRQHVLHLLDSHDPHAIWRIADNRTPVTIEGKALPLGNHLLLGSDWEGSLDLKDAPTLERFYSYAGSNR